MLKVLLFTAWLRGGLWEPWSILATAVALLALAWSVVATRRRPLAGFMALASVLCYALLAAVSEFRPMLMPRATLWVPVPLYVLLGCAVAGIASPPLRLCAMASAVAFQVTAAALHLPRCTTEPWRDMIASMAREAGPEDLIITLHGLSVPPLLYYWPGSFDAERCRSFDPGHKSMTAEGSSAPVFAECAARLSPPEVLSALKEGRGIWLIGSDDDLATVRQWSEELARAGTATALRGSGRTGSIVVVHFRR